MSHVAVQHMLDQALQHHRAGGLELAEPIYRDALALSPNHPDALYLLGTLHFQKGHTENAIAMLRRATAGNPRSATYRYALGQMLTAAGESQAAIASYRDAVRIKPDFAHAWNNLGMLLEHQGDSVAAGDAYHHALEIHQEFPELHNNLGGWYKSRGQIQQAIAQFRKAISLQHEFPIARFNLGATLASIHDFHSAIEEFRVAITQQPDFPQAYTAMGNALHEIGQIDQSIDAYERGIALNPGLATPYYNLGINYLLKGDFLRGWEGFESRRCVRDFMPFCRNFAEPLWDGSDLRGRSILLHAEQGFGDTIQFARYVTLVKQRGAGQIFVLTQPELQSLIGAMPGIDLTVSDEELLPPFDLHCPLPGLPLRLKTSLATIPASIPYLAGSPTRIEYFKRKLGHGSSRRVGLAWAGRPEHQNDLMRSITLSQLAPLAQTPNVRWISLQKGRTAIEAANSGIPLYDLTADLEDFSDTAALIANLDLVIAVDTAVAHLAGAMGKPVWVLLPFVPDWRWMLERDDSPWYPTMQLFRQPQAGDWTMPINQIAHALAHFAPHSLIK